MHKLIVSFLCFVALILVGCSSTSRTYIDTLKLAFDRGDGASLSNEELASRNRDVVYVKVGNLPQAVLVLAYTEFEQKKWISADNALLVMEHGRLIKTTGFSNDLLYMSDKQKDPLKQEMVKIQPGQVWQSYTDWSENMETGYLQQYEIVETTIEKLEIQGQQFDAKQVVESVVFFNGDVGYNKFWYDLTSGELIKSQQQLAPFWPQVEVIHVSTAGRLAGIVKQGSMN